ncbi:YHS domain-containing (seleno)protein [Reinekea sp.]|uniref:YHS domain-containing (seleno)protein n=1 Tax=Reinekea sp. TaxID=1970455 RepID=UPI003989D964
MTLNFLLRPFLFFLIGLFSVAYSDTFYNKTNQNVALDGFDTVEYFNQKTATKGFARYQVTYLKAVWYFSTQENKNIFEADPEKFIPQFGGHCANGLSDGHLVRANPEIFRVIDGRLYLFFSWWGKAQWKYDQQAQIALAESNWGEFSSNLD